MPEWRCKCAQLLRTAVFGLQTGWQAAALWPIIAPVNEARIIPGGRALLVAAVAVWVVAYVAWTTDWLLQPMPFMFERALRRIPVCAFGFGLSWALIRPLQASAGRPFAERLVFAAAVCAAASLIQACVNEVMFYVIAPRWGEARWIDLATQAMTVFWVFAAWTALYLALEYDTEAREHRLRLAGAEALALEASNRALMQQINPHFLFNALNTISGLIIEGHSEQADHTVLSLARLMRGSLDKEPPAFRSLTAEIDAQVDYIDVQHARFGERFRFVTDIAPDAKACLVPSLILQPLIENAFTHGVGRSEGEVTLEVQAHSEAGRLIINVLDNARPSGAAAATTGLGLENVRRRLDALFGNGASLTVGVREGGGYSATLVLPLRLS